RAERERSRAQRIIQGEGGGLFYTPTTTGPSSRSTEDQYVEPFLFRSDPGRLSSAGAATLRLGSDISTRAQLFERYALGLSFPDYFGKNWDALDECLRDFHWESQKRVVILHEELPRLPEKERRVYLAILSS